jgi:dTDP-4-dehydrorhamnose 3,5-epimerase
LEENTIFFYKCTQVYHKESERGIFWNDTDLKIQWGNDQPLVSEKDKIAGKFKEFISPF